MLSRPRLKQQFLPRPAGSERVFLLSERGHFLLQGRAIRFVLPLLDGSRTVAEIVTALAPELSMGEVLYALGFLTQRGYLVEAAPGLPAGAGAFWEIAGEAPAVASARLGQCHVRVLVQGGGDPALFEALLRDGGVGRVSVERSAVAEAGGAELTVVLADDCLNPEIGRWGRRALAAAQPWLFVKPGGVEPWIGPLFVPERTGCHQCLKARVAGSRKIERHLAENEGDPGPFPVSIAALASTRATALSIAATEVQRWLVSGSNERLEGKVVTFDTRTLSIETHTVVRRPQCDACGDPKDAARRMEAPVRLASRPKRFSEDGGHRSTTPAETYERLRHHISPVTGLVVEVWRSQSKGRAMGDVVCCFSAERNFVHMNEDIFRENLRRGAGGKGKTAEQARTGALAEALEHYAGVFQGYEPRIRARLVDLGAAAVHPNQCLCISDRQFEHRETWNRTCSTFNRIPERFRPDEEVEWSPAWSLTRDERRWVPTAYCFYEHAWKNKAGFAYHSSNGSAAGNNLEEAILQGLLELIERDAVAIWWYNRLRRPGVDLASFGEPYIPALADHFASLGRDLWALDLTSDLGIPVFAALSQRLDKPVEDIIMGFGAHLDPRIALTRAVTEMNQSLPMVIDVGPGAEDAYLPGNPEAVRWWKNATAACETYLMPAAAMPLRRHGDHAMCVYNDLADEVQHVMRVLAGQGLEVIVIDQSRPDVDLAVAQVIVPGLRPFWARFGPGRLYDVPVAMGDLAVPTLESDLNPYLVYF